MSWEIYSNLLVVEHISWLHCQMLNRGPSINRLPTPKSQIVRQKSMELPTLLPNDEILMFESTITYIADQNMNKWLEYERKEHERYVTANYTTYRTKHSDRTSHDTKLNHI